MPGNNNQFTIINNQGGTAVSGTFLDLPEGAETMISGQPYQISYHGGTDGDDVVLTSLVGTNTAVTPSSTIGDLRHTDHAHGHRHVGGFELHASTDGKRCVLQQRNDSLGSAPIDSSTGVAIAMLTGVILPGGDNSAITGVYSGDTSFAVSTSPAASDRNRGESGHDDPSLRSTPRRWSLARR